MPKVSGGIRCRVCHVMGNNSRVCPQVPNPQGHGLIKKCGNCDRMVHNTRTHRNIVQSITTNNSVGDVGR